MASKTAAVAMEDVNENTCVVCFKEVEIFSVGQCDHPVCFECSTRMRVLCRQNECPICRQDMPLVIFTRKVKQFEKIKDGKFVLDNKYKIGFFSETEKRAYDDLLAHVCSECKKVSPNFGHLRDHVRRVHQLNFCDLCVDNLKILTNERRCYSRKDLATHRRVGDPDDRSHRGHPLCEFCDKRYMDNEELYKHLRRDHLFCHFCDADGFHYYYKTYGSLREHYRNDHFLCEEGNCYAEQFTSVFRTEIDLKAHKASAHGKDLGKVGLKQARTLDIAFTLAPRPRASRTNRHHYNQPNSGGTGGGGRDEDSEATGAVGGAVAEEPSPSRAVEKPQQPPPAVSQLNTNCIAEFPTLGGAAPALPQTTLTPSASRKSASASVRPRNQFSMDDFPALGPDAGGGPRHPAPAAKRASAQPIRPTVQAPAAVTTSVTMKLNAERTPTSSTVPSQTNLSIQVSSQRFTTTVTSQNTYNIHFPALDGEGPGTAPPPPQPSAAPSTALQWTTTSKKSKKSNETQTSASQLSKLKPLPKMDDFPALESKSSKPLFPPTAPQKTTTGSNTAPIKTITTEDSLAAAKTKKKKSKSKGATGNAAPITIGSKPKAANVVQTEGGGVGAGEPHKNSMAHNKHALLYDGMIETEKSTIKQLDANIKMATAEEVELLRKNAAGNGKENLSQSSNHPKKPAKVDDDSAFPALPGFGPPPPGFAPKWEFKKISSSRTNTTKAKAPPPGLASPSAQVARPPPGLEPVAATVPPGLDSVAVPNPPPGFTPVNGSFPPLVTEGTFVNPPNLDARNTALVGKISSALGGDALTDFKQVSFAFRSGVLSSAEYYTYCKQVMGDKKFVAIFPELLALLPDITKQQELWPHYQEDRQQFELASTKGNRLVACETCGQVLRTSELREHLTKHSLDNNFPALDQPLTTGKNAWAK